MNKIVRIVKIIMICLSAWLSCGMLCAFERGDIVSPYEGVWRNRQMLLLNAPEGTDIYYSLSGADPYVSGFSYDGPALIDETGNVSLRITAVTDGVREDFTINYTVNEDSLSDCEPAAQDFFSSIRNNPLVEYTSGSSFPIPQGFTYSFEIATAPPPAETPAPREGVEAGSPGAEDGGAISLSARNTAERYVPIIMYREGAAFDPSSGQSFCFVIHVLPRAQDLPSPSAPPFAVTDWETISFTDRSFIYKVDNSNWLPYFERVRVDRTRPHIVYWQSVDYSPGNPVNEYYLPPRPSYSIVPNEDKSIAITLDTARGAPRSFSFGSGAVTAYVEAFPNEELNEALRLGVYLDGVYQGDIKVHLFIDRAPPLPPVIVSTAAALSDSRARGIRFARSKDDACLELAAERGANVFYAVSSPLPLSAEDISSYVAGSDAGRTLENRFNSLPVGNYIPYQNGEKILLPQGGQSAVYYQIRSFAIDSSGNRSEESLAELIIDETNFYLAPEGLGAPSAPAGSLLSGERDGSYGRPFSSFEQFEEVLDKTDRAVTLHIYGKIILPDRDLRLEKPCNLVGIGDATLVFSDKSCLTCSSGVNIQNIILEKHSTSVTLSPILRLNRATLNISQCELLGVFTKDARLIEAQDSTLNFSASGFTAQGDANAVSLSVADSSVQSSECRFTSVASDAVGVESLRSSGTFSNCTFNLIGSFANGIVAEGSSLSLTDNSFRAQLTESSNQSRAVWSDTPLLEDSQNTQTGF